MGSLIQGFAFGVGVFLFIGAPYFFFGCGKTTG